MSQNASGQGAGSEKRVRKFRLYKFIMISVLVLFLLGGLILFENDITVENLRYLIKYLDFSSSGAFSEESVIYYNEDSGNCFHVFRGDLALVNSGGVVLYDRRGSAVMTDSYNMTSPTAVCGDKYLAIYDLGGHQVRIYNSFSLLFEKSFDYTVQGVSINSDGAFCVVTSQKNYRSAVFVYDRNFDQIHQWLSADKFAFDAYLSDQDVLTISAVHAEDGDLICDLIELKVGDKDPARVFTVKNEIPLRQRTDRRGSVFVTDRALRRIEKGKEIHAVSFEEESIKKLVLGETCTAVLQDELSVGVNYLLRIFDAKGTETFSQKFSVSVQDIEVWDDKVYVLTHTELVVLSEKEETMTFPLEGDYSDVGVLSEDCVILCSQTEAHIKILD